MADTASDLEARLRAASAAYYNTSTAIMTDAEFDDLKDRLQALDPENPFLADVGAVVPAGNRARLPYWLGSQSKVKPGTGEVGRWAGRRAGPFVVTDKLDGTSCLVVYVDGGVRMYTRGDGAVGGDITPLAKHVLPAALRSPGGVGDLAAVRGELIMTKAAFAQFADEFNDERGLVNGLVNRKAPPARLAKEVQFVAYEVLAPRMPKTEQLAALRRLGFPTAHSATVPAVDDQLLSELYRRRLRESPYRIDGLVVEDDGPWPANTSGNPGYAVAFKMPLDEQGAATTVIEVLWEASKDGLLKPRAHFEPVHVRGTRLQYATAFNAKYVVQHALGPGSVIRVVRSGDVIPFIAQVLAPAPNGPQLPSQAYDWGASGVDVRLRDPGASADVAVKRLVKFFREMGVDNLSDGLVARFYAAGLTDVSGYLAATRERLAGLPGVQATLAAKLHGNIQGALRDVPLVRVMVASNEFGGGLGSRKLEALLAEVPDLLTAPAAGLADRIAQVEGFQAKTADKVLAALPRFKVFLRDHPQIQLRRQAPPARAAPAVPATTPSEFAGRGVVFTGFRDADMQARLQALGATVQSAVNGKTLLVVTGDPSSTTVKIQKAREAGLDVVGVEAFRARLAAAERT